MIPIYEVIDSSIFLATRHFPEKYLKYLLEMQELTDITSCVLLMLKKQNPSVHYDGSSGGGYLIPHNSTTEALVSLSATVNFIGCWLQALEKIAITL